MWDYHEVCHEAYYAEAALEHLRTGEPSARVTEEPIKVPAILIWIAAVIVACCALLATIHALS